MRKMLLLIVSLAVILSLVGCDGGPLYDINYPKPVVVEPDESTRYTINGYKDTTSNPENFENSASSEDVINSENSVSGDTRLIGNSNSKKLHKIGCSYIKNLKEENICIFDNVDDAVLEGYSKCTRCFK